LPATGERPDFHPGQIFAAPRGRKVFQKHPTMFFDPDETPLLDENLLPAAENSESSGQPDDSAEPGSEQDPSLPAYLPRDSRGRADFSHHRRRCLVCNHAYRSLIEHDYLTWRDPASIARDCGFSNKRPILRHAEATGLDRLRSHRVTSALERLIEQASSTEANANSIINAVKLYAQMNGSLTPQPRQVVVTHVRRSRPARAGSKSESQPTALRRRSRGGPGLTAHRRRRNSNR
jgi:hypothetical protein